MSTGNLKKNKQNSGGGTVDTDIEAALAKKQDKLRFDTEPTEGSNNPVTSGGIKAAIEANLNDKQDKLTFDDTPTVGSMNPVTSHGIKEALEQKVDVYTHGGFCAGKDASIFYDPDTDTGGDGVAIGLSAVCFGAGAALGGYSTVGQPGFEKTSHGGAVGSKAFAGNGFAGGMNAQTIIVHDGQLSYIEPIDAIQLGTGTNSKPKTMQVYDYTMMDADGTIPEERIADLPLAKTDENNNFTTSQTITGTLTVNGDIVQNGASYESHAEQLYTKNDLIKTRDGAVGGLGDGEYTGIEAEKYDGTNNGRLVFDANGTARVGDVGSEQPLLTREEAANLVDGQVLVWDGTKLKAVSSDGYVKNSDYATSSKYGVMKPGNGLVSTNGVVSVTSATSQMIDNKTNGNYPITPANIDYAVRSVLPKTADTIPATLVVNTEYYAGELATVSFALPTTGKLGQYCFVKFDSGATATTLTVTGSYAGDIPTPVANKTYEIIATWNGSKWVCSYRGY